MRLFYRIFADGIWIFHLCVVLISLFGWLIPSIWYVYIAVLAAVFVTNTLFDYCLLSKWEFDLRTRIHTTLVYDYAYTSYYTYRLTRGYLSRNFLRYAGIGFTGASLVINFYFRYFF